MGKKFLGKTAYKKQFVNAKSARPDLYRASSSILMDVFLGKIEFYFKANLKVIEEN